MTGQQEDWYLLRPEVRSNALKLSDLERLAHRGVLRRNDLIWQRGWEGWVPAESVIELAASFDDSGRIAAGSKSSSAQKSLGQKLGHEILSYGAITAFLLIILFMLKMYEDILLERYKLQPENEASLIFSALVLGKVILIAEVIRLGNRVAILAPIYSIIARSIIFALALFAFHVLEDMVMAHWHGKPLLSGLADYQNIKLDVAVVCVLTISLLPYHAFKELQRATGSKRLFAHLFNKIGGRD